MKVLFATLCVLVADQVTKICVRGLHSPLLGLNIPGMPLYSTREIFGEVLNLTYVRNPGTAFGIGPGFTVVFGVFSLLASAALLFYLYKVRGQGLALRLAFAILLGGAAGNMIDRVFLGPILDGTALFSGRVIDFIELNLFNFPFVFNIADASVTIGVFMLLFMQRKAIMKGNRMLAENAADSGEGTANEKNDADC